MDNVCTMKKFGVLGMPNLHLFSLAYRTRWNWLQRVEPDRLYTKFNIQIQALLYTKLIWKSWALVRCRCWTAVHRPRIRHES
jgi:hypothetical protein